MNQTMMPRRLLFCGLYARSRACQVEQEQYGNDKRVLSVVTVEHHERLSRIRWLVGR